MHLVILLQALFVRCRQKSRLPLQALGALFVVPCDASTDCTLWFREADSCALQVPAASESFARTYSALLSSRSQFHAAFVTHLLTLADAGLMPTERMDACLALICTPRGAA